MTKLADELNRKLPAMVGTFGIAQLAYDELKRADRKPVVAHDAFWEKVRGDAGLLRGLIAAQFGLTDDQLKSSALSYLQERRNDMARRGGDAERMDGGEGHRLIDARHVAAPSPSTPLPGEGQRGNDAQPPIAQPRQSHEREAGQGRSDSQPAHAPSRSPNDSGGGQLCADAQTRSAPAAVAIIDPSPARLMAERDAVKYLANASQREWLKVYRISGGLQPMHTAIANLANLRRRSVRDGTREFYDAVIIRALEKATAPYVEANPNATPADILSKEEIARIEDAVAFDKVKNRAAEWVRNFPELDVKQMEMADAV